GSASKDNHGIQVRGLVADLDRLALAAIGLVFRLQKRSGGEASAERLHQVARLEPGGEQLLRGSLRPLAQAELDQERARVGSCLEGDLEALLEVVALRTLVQHRRGQDDEVVDGANAD